MTSLLTNVSAMTALKSLNATNKSIEITQARISTGLAVGGAADNAAYWSIATTMRSDNKALGAVQDSLGLGAATIDVAYTAMDASKDVLDEIKTKLVAAKQPGVEKAKIQAEIDQLQEQLRGIASAATFSGNNWLAVDTASAGYKTSQQIVSSFSRGSDGAIEIGSVDIDVGGLALVDAANGGGTLLDFGGHAVLTSGVFAWDKGSSPAMDDGGTMFMKYVIDGGAVQTVTFTVADANAGPTLDEVVDALNGGLVGATASKSESGDRLVVTSDSVGANASVQAYDVYGHTSSDAYSDANLGLIYPPGNRDASGAPTGAASVFDIDITDPAADLDVLIADIDAASGRVISAAADLGAIKSRISMQSDFASALMDAVERGVGQLVDADMSKESTRLQALQVQQQLGIQSLSIANSNAQTILSLFR